MTRLEIKNFDTAVMDIYSDYFMIKSSADMDDKYVIGIEINDVVSFNPLDKKHYTKHRLLRFWFTFRFGFFHYTGRIICNLYGRIDVCTFKWKILSTTNTDGMDTSGFTFYVAL